MAWIFGYFSDFLRSWKQELLPITASSPYENYIITQGFNQILPDNAAFINLIPPKCQEFQVSKSLKGLHFPGKPLNKTNIIKWSHWYFFEK